MTQHVVYRHSFPSPKTTVTNQHTVKTSSPEVMSIGKSSSYSEPGYTGIVCADLLPGPPSSNYLYLYKSENVAYDVYLHIVVVAFCLLNMCTLRKHLHLFMFALAFGIHSRSTLSVSPLL